jgi:predicted RNA-binding protein with PUA-like domain
MLVDVRALRRTPYLTPAALRAHPELAGLQVLRRGNRLSITPVTPQEWTFLVGLLR